jgi:multiple antibiotic resistance protein
MLGMSDQAIRDFLMLFVTIDPIGTLSLFVPLTAHLTPPERRGLALRSVVYGGGVLMAFLVLGELLLTGLGVRLVSFQLAGGVILFLVGLQMIFGTGVAAQRSAPEPGHDLAVFPLALPSIAGPGSIMAVVLLTENHGHSILEQALTAGVLVVVLGLTFLVLWAAEILHRLLGRTGASVIVRVMGLILAALATEQVVAGIEAVLRQPLGG